MLYVPRVDVEIVGAGGVQGGRGVGVICFGYANNVELDSFFKKEILDDAGQIAGGTPTSAYARQLSNAKHFFRKKFLAFDSPEKLATWFELVESRLLFNVFEVEDEFDVCLTFEAMNNRVIRKFFSKIH